MGKNNVKLLVLINFVDRHHCSPKLIGKITRMLEKQGHDFRLVKFTSRDHSVQAIEKAKAQGFDTLIMGGGDGTVHNLFNLSFEKDFTFGIIPLGTVNALARSLGLSKNPEKALYSVIKGRIRNVDVGKVAGRLFTCFASIGFDASVVHTINPRAKVLMERVAFAYQGIKRLFSLKELAQFRAEPLPLGKTLSGYSLILSNIPNYAGFHFFSQKPDDGSMEMLLFKRNTILDYLASVAKMGIQGSKSGAGKDKRLFRTKATTLTVKCPQELFLQLDGEAVRHIPGEDLKFEIMPGAARFLSP